MSIAAGKVPSGDNVASAPATFPMDIIEEILDCVVTTKDSWGGLERQEIWYTSSLVSRNWVRPAQKRIFSIITLTDSDSTENFCTLVRVSPHLSDYVLSLIIRSPAPIQLSNLPLLANARSLTIFFLRTSEYDIVSVWRHLATVLPSLASLKLWRSRNSSLELLFLLPHAFPHLVDLHMSYPIYTELHADTSDLLLPELSMQDLTLKSLVIKWRDGDAMPDYAILLAKYRFLGHLQLQSLTIDSRAVHDSASMIDFLRIIATTLQSLTIHVRYANDEMDVPTFDLSANSALRNVCIMLSSPAHGIASFIDLLPLARSCSQDVVLRWLVQSENEGRLDLGNSDAWATLVHKLRRNPLRARCDRIEVSACGYVQTTPMDVSLPQCAQDAQRDFEEMGISLMVEYRDVESIEDWQAATVYSACK